ncbi:MAG: AbrB/MazE/SpoVT family DNA-binding domain-containing protein [Candidatus Saccharibacteria bacterium]
MNKIRFWGTSRVGSKGQVVIPSKAREIFGIQEGDQLLVVSPPDKNGVLLIKTDELEKILSGFQSNIADTLSTINKAKEAK